MRHEFVRSELGTEAEARYLEQASSHLKAFFSGLQPDEAWIDFRLFIEANSLLESQFGSGDLAMVRRAGHYAALHNAGVWKSLFEKGVDPPKFVEIAGGLWHKHYDVGSLVRTVVADGVVKVEIRGMPVPHRTHCISVAGWVEGVFTFRPGASVRVEELACRDRGDQTCEIQVLWDALDGQQK
jgi:hypothetical protein